MRNESFLSTFVEECGEHLASVENDLIEMERLGSEVDAELVNRVFRAAHSIKGGAGFFELNTIKELGHRLENVLELIRSRTLAPNPEVVNMLLGGFDRLKTLLADVEGANEADITEEVVALAGLASSYLPPSRKAEAVVLRRFPIPGSDRLLEAGALQIEAARAAGEGIALLRFDLIHDVQRLGKTPLEILKALEERGRILDCLVDIASVGGLDEVGIAAELPFYVLYATARPVMELAASLEIPGSGVTLLELPKTPLPRTVEDAPEAAAAQAAPSAMEAAAPSPAAPASRVAAPKERRPGARSAAGQAGLRGPDALGEAASAPEGAARREEGEGSVRIQVAVLDQLMNIAGELVLARNELVEAIAGGEKRSILGAGRRIDLVTREMQEAVMLTRMQPIGNLFGRYPRIVRDMARDSGKKIELSISGREVEVDKTILETLSDPLTHLVRNACDHGIETAEQRAAAGKPPTGTVWLRARHEAGMVVVEVREDGGGIDLDAVGAKALALGLVSPERLKAMGDKERAALILLPGLSTAKKVTDISGRGVGMDVVKTNIDKIGGQIDIVTERGRGTVFRIKLPLTLAIIPSLLVSVSSERYAIPQANVEELLRVRPGNAKNRIESVGDRSVLVLRGSFIPIVRLADALGLPREFHAPASRARLPEQRGNLVDRRRQGTGAAEPEAATPLRERALGDRRYHAESDLSVVVVNSAALRYALVVDELHDTLEIVVKPLGRHFAKLREYSGATILGNGSTALILDTTGLAARAALVSAEGSPSRAGDEGAQEPSAGTGAESLGLLLFRNGESERCAMRLESVERVVRVSREQIDVVGSTRAYTHEGRSVLVFALSDALGVADITAGEGELALILARAGGRLIGLLATPPVDSMSAEVHIDETSFSGGGLAGSAVIGGKTTLVVDVESFARSVKPDWFAAAEGQAVEADRPAQERGQLAGPGPRGDPARGPLILLAEDSAFFRAKVSEILSEGGYRVLAAADGAEALERFLAGGEEIAALVTDIEMPGLDGFELARRIRARGAKLPIVALTSLASDEDRARGLEAGIDDFQVKLDQAELLRSLAALLRPGGPPSAGRPDAD